MTRLRRNFAIVYFFNKPTSHTTISKNSLALDSAFLSEVAVNHLKKARGEIWPNRSERRNNTKTTKMRTKTPQ